MTSTSSRPRRIRFAAAGLSLLAVGAWAQVEEPNRESTSTGVRRTAPPPASVSSEVDPTLRPALELEAARIEIRRDPTNRTARLFVADRSYELGNLTVAREQYEAFLALSPPGADSLRAAFRHARCLLTLGLKHRATRALSALAKREGAPAGALHDLASLLRADGFPVEAAIWELRAVSVSGGEPAYLREAAALWKEIDRPDQSIQLGAVLTRLGDATAEDWFQLGLAAHRMGAYDRAEEAYGQARSRDPRAAEASYNLGLLHERAGRYESAVACYEQVLSCRPDLDTAYFRLGSLHLERGASARAIDVLDRFLAVGKDSLVLAEARLLLASIRGDSSAGSVTPAGADSSAYR